MFKPIPGNMLLYISLNGNVKDINGRECTLPVDPTGRVKVEMYGKMWTVSRQWLILISQFEVNLVPHLQNRIMDIQFVKGHPRLKFEVIDGWVMIFKGLPLIVKKEFRLIPGFPRYAVKWDGSILDIVSGEVKSPLDIKGNGINYLQTSLYCPSINAVHSKIVIHRLVALAWVPNTDPQIRYMVNHIDGNKRNPHAKNLEWVTPTENAEHAFEAGLRTDNKPCRVRNIESGEVFKFKMLGKAMRFMGLNSRLSSDVLKSWRISNPISGKWEIRLAGDDRPWYFEGKDLTQVKPGRYNVFVTFADGREKMYYDTRDICKELKLWNVGGGIYKLYEKAKTLYPGIKFEITDMSPIRKLEALRIETGELIQANSIRDLCRKTGLCRHMIKTYTSRREIVNINGYAFRYVSDQPWPEVIPLPKGKPVCIRATNEITQEVRVYNSLREAAKGLQVERKTIDNRIQNGKSFKGWLFAISDTKLN